MRNQKQIEKIAQEWANVLCNVLSIRDEDKRKVVGQTLLWATKAAAAEALADEKTPDFSVPIPGYGDVYHFKEWQENCAAGGFNDDDGFGHPASVVGNQTLMDEKIVLSPSRCNELPEGTTHVVWFNR